MAQQDSQPKLAITVLNSYWQRAPNLLETTRSLVGFLGSVVTRHPIVAINLAYLLIWFAFSAWHSVPFASIETDGMGYIKTAQTMFTPNFRLGNPLKMGYPAAIWLVHLLLPDWFQAAKAVSGFAGLIFINATLRWIEELFDRPTALIGLCLILTNVFVISYSSIAMSDMLAAALALLALLVVVRFRSIARYAAAGVLVALALATRYPYLALILTGALVWLPERTTPSRVRAVLLYYTFVLAAIPLLLLNRSILENPLLKFSFADFGYWFHSSPLADTAHSWQDALGLIAANPRFFAFGYLKAVAFDLPIYLVHVAFYATFFTLAGWALALQRPEKRDALLVGGAFLAPYVLFTGLGWLTHERFWLFTLPFIAAGCALLIVRLSENRSYIGLGLLILLLAANVVGFVDNLHFLMSEQAPEFQVAGEIIRRDAPPNAVILVSQPQIAYFAERPAVIMADVQNTWAELPQVISERGISFVVMDDRYGTFRFPDLEKIFDPDLMTKQFPDWQLIYSGDQRPRIVVYRVSPE